MSASNQSHITIQTVQTSLPCEIQDFVRDRTELILMAQNLLHIAKTFLVRYDNAAQLEDVINRAENLKITALVGLTHLQIFYRHLQVLQRELNKALREILVSLCKQNQPF